jgi:predicted metal-binding protein
MTGLKKAQIMDNKSSDRSGFAGLEAMFKEFGFTDYKWIDPEQIVVSQWVRMKCMFGCPNYGHKAACPPQTPSVSDCERFFKEYKTAVVFHLRVQFDNPEERFLWYKKMTLKLVELERRVFLCNLEKAFFLLFGGCPLCKECKVERTLCKQPERARPAPEGMAVDVYSTIKKLGYPIAVRTEYTEPMDRYVFLMVN